MTTEPHWMRMLTTKAFDLNLLRVFAYIYVTRNLTRTAEKLNITQPAVSRSLSKLNDLYGEKLFIWQNKEMVPSRLAEHISDNIFNALEQADSALSFGSNFKKNSQPLDIKIGMNDYGVNVFFSTLYTSLQESKVNINLHSVHCTHANVLDKIEEMTIDSAIVSEAPKSKRVESVPLFTDDYVVICRKQQYADVLKTVAETSANTVIEIANEETNTLATLPLAVFLSKSHLLVSYDGSNQGWVDERLLAMGYKRDVVCTTHIFSSTAQIVIELDIIATLPRKIAMSLAKHYPITLYELPFENKTHHFHFIRPRYSIHASYSTFVLDTVLQATASL